MASGSLTKVICCDLAIEISLLITTTPSVMAGIVYSTFRTSFLTTSSSRSIIVNIIVCSSILKLAGLPIAPTMALVRFTVLSASHRSLTSRYPLLVLCKLVHAIYLLPEYMRFTTRMRIVRDNCIFLPTVIFSLDLSLGVFRHFFIFYPF